MDGNESNRSGKKETCWSQRGEVSKQQIDKFNENAFTYYKDNLRKFIQSWMSNEDAGSKIRHGIDPDPILGNDPIEVDMDEIVEHSLSGESSEMNNVIKCIEKNAMRQYSNQGNEMSQFEYLWVTQCRNGMVNTVGKSHFTNPKLPKRTDGDLFDLLKVKPGSVEVILRAEFGNDFFDKTLVRYNKVGWMIPVLITEGQEITIQELERDLGDYLIVKEIPVLNYYSHKNAGNRIM